LPTFGNANSDPERQPPAGAPDLDHGVVVDSVNVVGGRDRLLEPIATAPLLTGPV
jgi:hypothetical protein